MGDLRVKKNKLMYLLSFTLYFTLAGCSDIEVGSPDWCALSKDLKDAVGEDHEMWKDDAEPYKKYCEK